MTDNRVNFEEFDAKYPNVKAASVTVSKSGVYVNTAITAGKYISYNWQTGKYDVEPR